MQEREGVVVRPRVAVDPWRHERVVHVADREDARVERQVALAESARIAGSVEPLVVAVQELVNDGTEKSATPTTSATHAARLSGAGTFGTTRGNASPISP